MILNSIEIKNIRSIRDEFIEFPSSTMLFFGDVGSGKSSVLKSIEFALFGTLIHGDLSGDSLLRRGRNKGSVKLQFSVDGKDYSIFRSLTRDRKGRVSQNNCLFIDEDDGSKVTLAPTDMRRKVLSLLSYSVSRYEKANKLPLFRYTVYTPQEQIKEIIQADPDERFEILKEVFGIEKYEVALRNVDTIKDFLNDYLKEIKTIIKQIGDPEKEIGLKEKEIEEIKKAIKKSEKFIFKKEQEITRKEKDVEALQKELELHTKKILQINNKESNIQENKAKQKKTMSKLTKIQKEIAVKEEEREKLKDVKEPSDINENELEKTIEKLNNLILSNEKEKAIISKNIADINDLIKQGKCSLCGQAIHEKERFEKELNEASLRLKELSTKINNQTKKIKKKQALLKEVREFQKIIIERENITQIISEKVERAKDLNNSIEELFKSIEENQNDILSILSEYKIPNLQEFKDLEKKIRNNLDKAKKDLTSLKSQKETAGNELSGHKKSLQYSENDLNKIRENIEKIKKLQTDLILYSQIKNWISEEFPVLIRDIEKKIISSSAHHFNSYFKEWFHELVEDTNIEVEIRTDDFQPVVYVNGYESPFKDLSGGEKSGLSLAYRLALNKIINERYQEVKTKDLLILDEPTDGFSQQQINRMQPIFEKLDTAQMIIISHERNLDSFVTDIFHFEKENHVTKIKKESS